MDSESSQAWEPYMIVCFDYILLMASPGQWNRGPLSPWLCASSLSLLPSNAEQHPAPHLGN